MDHSQPSSQTNLLETPEDEKRRSPLADGYTSNDTTTDTDTETEYRPAKHYRIASIGSSDVSYSEHQTSTVIRISGDDTDPSEAPELQSRERRNELGRMNAPTPPVPIPPAGQVHPRASSPYGAVLREENSTINYRSGGNPQRKPMRKTLSGKSVAMVDFPCRIWYQQIYVI